MHRILIATVLACSMTAAEGQPVAVANGDFESGAKGWENGPVLTAEQKHGGGKSLALAKGFVFQSPGATIPIEAGSDYRLRLWVKTAGCAENDAAVCAMFRGPDGSSVVGGWVEGANPAYIMDGGQSPVLAAFGGTADWREVVVGIPAAQIPAGAGRLHVYLRHDLRKEPSGTVFIDDLSAERLPAGGIPVEIIRNGGFERGKAGWWGDGAWEVVAGKGVGGGSALRVAKGFVCQDKRPVEGRKNYRITMQVRAEACAEGAIFVQTGYRNGDKPIGSWHGPLQAKLQGRSELAVVVDGGDHDWRTVSIVVQAPPAATQLLLYLRKQDGPGAAWYDDVRVEPTTDKPFTAADRRAGELRSELLPPPVAGFDAAAALAAAAKLGTQPAPERFVIASAGAARAHIHVSSSAGVVAMGAAKELAACLKQITGADPAPISHDANPVAGPLLVIGRDSVLAAGLAAGIDWDGLGPDGFVIRSVGQHLLLAGATDRGTQYAVTWFLDRTLGVRWLAPGCTRMPSAPDLAVARMDVRQVPSFAYREVLSDEGSNAAFAAHNLLNGRSHGPSFAPTAPEIDTWEHDWMAMGGSANFMELLPQKTYGQAHPEWYHGGQVAMMDKGMRAAMAKEVIERLRAHPDYTRIWYNIWQMDWGWDMDPASKAFADAHGGNASAPRLDMMIDIADQVRAVLPGARFAMQAYTWAYTPPTGMTVPDYLLVFPMTLHVDYKTPLNAGRNQQLGADIVQWTKLAKHVQVWDHIANWAGFLQPTPNIYPIGDSIRWLATLPGLRGYFCEGNWNSPGCEFGALRAWLIARLTWDATQDPRALVAEWCRGCYGKAAPQLIAYIDLMHAAAAKSDDVLGQRYMPDLPMYDLAFVSAADALFDQAEAAVADDAEALARVRQARMPVDYLALLRRGEYAAAAAKQGSPWQADTARRRARFDQGLVDNKVREYRQGGGVKELAALLDVERVAAQPDPLVKDLKPGDWAEVQDLAFMRFDTAWIVQDPAASDHAAIRMSGKSSTWAMQLPLGGVPKNGEWDLYAAVRVEAEPGHDDEPGVRVGSAPPMGLFNTATIRELNDGAYHLVKVPGGPHHWEPNNPQKSVYIQSPAKPWITWVYLDRIIAVRHK